MTEFPIPTAPQRRMLMDIVRDGERSYNGRGRRPITALAEAGLVEYDFTLDPHADGRYTERFTVRPTDAGRAFASPAMWCDE